MQGEEVDEREQRGADDERRHGRRQRATAALAGRRHRQQRGRRLLLLLVLVPLHAARGRASAATCSAPEPEAGKSVVGLVRLVKCSCFPHSAARNKLTFLGLARLSQRCLEQLEPTSQPRRAATLRYTPGSGGGETGDWRGRKEEAAGRSRGEERHQWMEPAGRPSRARLCFCSFALDASLSPNLCRPFYFFVFFRTDGKKIVYRGSSSKFKLPFCLLLLSQCLLN